MKPDSIWRICRAIEDERAWETSFILKNIWFPIGIPDCWSFLLLRLLNFCNVSLKLPEDFRFVGEDLFNDAKTKRDLDVSTLLGIISRRGAKDLKFKVWLLDSNRLSEFGGNKSSTLRMLTASEWTESKYDEITCRKTSL